jgi:hypothetical protein
MFASVSQAEDVTWWGHKLGFVSGGFLGAKSWKNKARKGPSNVRQMFGEDDQENLYNLVQVGMQWSIRPPSVLTQYFSFLNLTFKG